MSDYYDLGLDGLNLSGASSTGSASSSSLGDFWADTMDFLEQGIGMAGDLAGLPAMWEEATNPSYSGSYQPADEQQLSNLNSAAKSAAANGSEWVAGIPNGAVMLGGVALLVLVVAMARG